VRARPGAETAVAMAMPAVSPHAPFTHP
jgi:hypothetical protein